jgi:hypothetical protein
MPPSNQDAQAGLLICAIVGYRASFEASLSNIAKTLFKKLIFLRNLKTTILKKTKPKGLLNLWPVTSEPESGWVPLGSNTDI